MQYIVKYCKMKFDRVLICLFTAIICCTSFIQIPLFMGVPISIQDMMVIITGIILGPLKGSISVLLFLFIGIIGFPVFAAKGGIGVLLYSPTSGFLIGYFFACLIGGLLYDLLKSKNNSQIKEFCLLFLVVLISNIILFIFGIFGFMNNMKCDLYKAFILTILPFLPANIIKLFLSVVICKKIRPIVSNYI